MIISGTVIHGEARGRTLGFPTVNIALEKPLDPGVFSGYTRVDKKWLPSAVFIFPDKPLLEAHILDFEGDVYGKEIEVNILKKIRGPLQFDSAEMLRSQIVRDIANIRKKLNG